MWTTAYGSAQEAELTETLIYVLGHPVFPHSREVLKYELPSPSTQHPTPWAINSKAQLGA